MTRFVLLLLLFVLPFRAVAEAPSRIGAEAPGRDAIRLAVLTDMSASLSKAAGYGSVEAAQMAVEEAGSSVLGRPVVLISGDYQNRPDLALHMVQSWLGKESVDAVLDVPNGAIAAELQKEVDDMPGDRHLVLASGAGRMNGATGCKGALSWLYDEETLARNLVHALARNGTKRWFVIGTDDTHGHLLSGMVKEQITLEHGEIVGDAVVGRRMQGLAPMLKQAEAAKAEMVFLAFDRQDLLHLLRHWPDKVDESGKPVPLALAGLFLTDLTEGHRAPPFFTITPFYWNANDATRTFAQAFAARNRGAMPTEIQAAVYASTRHYLTTLRNGKPSLRDPLAAMKAQPVSDPVFNGTRIRGDGLVMHPLYLLIGKEAAQRSSPWDQFAVKSQLAIADTMLPVEAVCSR